MPGDDAAAGAGEHRHRIYDAWLGGRSNHEVDRRAALLAASVAPWLPVDVQAERSFAHRAVRHLAQHDVTQFLVLGCGYPLSPNVHDVVQVVTPDARVCYVVDEADAAQDPTLLTRAEEALTTGSTVTVSCVDVYRPRVVLMEALSHLNPSLPVAVLVIGTLSRLPDDDAANRLVESLCAALKPGSHLVVSHLVDAQAVRGDRVRTARTQAALQSTPELACTLRSPETVTGFLDGLDLLGPGVVPVDGWRPADRLQPGPRASILGGVARIPARAGNPPGAPAG